MGIYFYYISKFFILFRNKLKLIIKLGDANKILDTYLSLIPVISGFIIFLIFSDSDNEK